MAKKLKGRMMHSGFSGNDQLALHCLRERIKSLREDGEEERLDEAKKIYRSMKRILERPGPWDPRRRLRRCPRCKAHLDGSAPDVPRGGSGGRSAPR
jgi:hypothetical protein